MMPLRTLLCVAVIIATACRCTPSATPRASGAPGRGAYVRDAAALVGDRTARSALRERVVTGEIAIVAPYGLGPLLATPADRAALAAWLEELRGAGAQLVAPIAASSRLDELAVLVGEHPAAWFDAVVTESEYWNAADRARGFAAMQALVADMHAHGTRLAPGHTLRVGAYLGYPTEAEAAELAATLDFVFLDYSVTSAAAAWSHVHARGGPLRDRFAWFAGAGVEAWPIFYAAGEVDMTADLRSMGFDGAEARFRADLTADRDYGELPVAGFMYFTLESLPRGASSNP